MPSAYWPEHGESAELSRRDGRRSCREAWAPHRTTSLRFSSASSARRIASSASLRYASSVLTGSSFCALQNGHYDISGQTRRAGVVRLRLPGLAVAECVRVCWRRYHSGSARQAR